MKKVDPAEAEGYTIVKRARSLRRLSKFELACQRVREALLAKYSPTSPVLKDFANIERRASRVSGKEDEPVLHLQAGRSTTFTFCGLPKHDHKSVRFITTGTDLDSGRWCEVCVLVAKAGV